MYFICRAQFDRRGELDEGPFRDSGPNSPPGQAVQGRGAGEPGQLQKPELDRRVQGIARQPRPVRGHAVRQQRDHRRDGRARRQIRHRCIQQGQSFIMYHEFDMYFF